MTSHEDRSSGSTSRADRASVPAQLSRRRFRRLNLTLMLPLIVAVGVLVGVRQAQTWPQAVVLMLGVVAVVVTFERWTAGEVLQVALPCLAVAAAVWPFGVLAIGGQSQSAFYAVAVVGCFIVSQLPRHRVRAASGLAGYVAAVGGLGLVLQPDVSRAELLSYLVIPTGFTVVLASLMVPNTGFYDAIAELEATRERDAELAVARERIRFAGDLHDIQGHTLHVVKLKVALAQRLLHTDVARVEHELREVHTLLGDTIVQAKELAHGHRRLNLSAELENARNLFEAAGIHVRIDRPADVTAQDVDLMGQVLRETTTNILRHARAATVHVALAENGITIVNDGVDLDRVPELRGLAALAARVAEHGGELTVGVADGRFRTAATFPVPSAGAVVAGPAAAGSDR